MQTAFFATTDTKLAATLATVGVELRHQDPISRVVQKGRETWHYWFSTEGAQGKSTGELSAIILAGQDATNAVFESLPEIAEIKDALAENAHLLEKLEAALAAANWAGVLSGSRGALHNRETLLDLGNHHCRRLVKVSLPGGAVMLADEKLSAETKRQVAQLVM
jgi:hypothetical protein